MTSTGPPDVPANLDVSTRTSAAAVMPAATTSSPAPNGPTATAPNTPAAVTVPLRNDKPVFSSPKDTCQLQYELSHHPDRDFVSSLLNTLRFGARIGYTGPQKSRVSRNLISASQHPEVVSRNISNVIYICCGCSCQLRPQWLPLRPWAPPKFLSLWVLC